MGFRELLENLWRFTLLLQYLQGLPPGTFPLVLYVGLLTQGAQRQNPYLNMQLETLNAGQTLTLGNFLSGFQKQT